MFYVEFQTCTTRTCYILTFTINPSTITTTTTTTTMSSSNNSNYKHDGSVITANEFNDKVTQGNCMAAIALSALFQAGQELKETGGISPGTHKMLLMVQFNCLATSESLGLSAADIEFNSTCTSPSSKVLSKLAYELDGFVQRIKIFLKDNNMGHIPPEYSALLAAMASPTKEPSSPPPSIAMSVKRKRASNGKAGPVLKRADDGDATKSIQVYDSDGLLDDAGDDATVTTTNTPTISTLTDSFKKKQHPKILCICGNMYADYKLKAHLTGHGLAEKGTGKKKHMVAIHSRKFMELYYMYGRGEAGFTDKEKLCLSHFKEVIPRMLTDDKQQKLLASKTTALFEGDVEIEGPHMLNFVRTFLPEYWAKYLSILPADSAAAKYAASLPQIATSLPSLDTKRAATGAISPNAATDGDPPSPFKRADAIPEIDVSPFKSPSFSDEADPPSLKPPASTSSTVVDKSIGDIQLPGICRPTRHASSAVAAPNTPIGQTRNTIFNTSSPTVHATRATHAPTRTSTTSASMPSNNGSVSNVGKVGTTTIIPAASNTANAPPLLSVPTEGSDPPARPAGGETTENPFDMLERLLRLKRLATESQSDRLAAKIAKRIEILENELFPDL